MPHLSPAAEAIRKALAERYCCEPDDIPRSMFEMESVAGIVLRVAADRLFGRDPLPDGYEYSAPAEAWHYEFDRLAHERLYAIAAQLDMEEQP